MTVLNHMSTVDMYAALSNRGEEETNRLNAPFAKRNLLFVQEAPCIRNYKMATALRKRGHRVTLAYTRARLSQMYAGLSDDVYTDLIHINNFRNLWDISKDFDIVHCHNEPDILTVAALGGAAPVVHDTHDLISLRANGDENLSFFEGVANRGAAGRVYTTPYQLKEAQKLYGEATGPSAVLYNYAVEDDLPRQFKPKLSQNDGQIHLVYEGGVGTQGHRNYFDLFFALARLGIHLHIYPTVYDPNIAKVFSQNNYLYYHHPLSPKQIMEEMTQYDAGIIPFNTQQGNKRFLDSTIANKLFEYLAAGLPVIASPLQSYIDYFDEVPAGKVFHNPQQALEALRYLVEQAKTTDFRAFARTYEGEIWRVEQLYSEILGDASDVKAKSADQAGAGRVHVSASLNDVALAVNQTRARPDLGASAVDQPVKVHKEPVKMELDKWITRRYQKYYQDRPKVEPMLEERLKGILSRYLAKEIETAVDLGCGQGQYADFLQSQGKMVLGLDLVNRLAYPEVRFKGQPAWRLDQAMDLAYAIQLLQHIPEKTIDSTLQAIAKHCRLFFAEIGLLPSGERDFESNELHLTLKPVNWWLRRLATHFAEVKILAITKNWFWTECSHQPIPVFDGTRMQGYQSWNQVTGQQVTPYRELWNQHARSLPWRGRVLYIGSNALRKSYYTREFFQAGQVLHVDPDPKNQPDVVTVGEDLSHFQDASVEGVAFFGTPYLMNDPQKFVSEAKRVLKPGGLISGSFNGPQSRWQGLAYKKGKVKTENEIWHFERDVLEIFEDWTVLYWARQNDEYYHLSAVNM